MDGFHSKRAGIWLMLTGLLGFLSLGTLLLFFLSFFQDASSLNFMGRLNDQINVLAGIAAAATATVLHPTLRLGWPRLAVWLLIGVWTGAAAISFGSWLILTGKSDVELSSYYYFLGNGLIGLWVWALNRLARRRPVWPRSLTGWGQVAGIFMMLGLPGLYGILMGWDGNDYSPLVLVAGFSFLGTGILYPSWCMRLGLWILAEQGKIPV